MGKKVTAKPPPGIYRDDPDRDDAASTSSAVLLEDVEQLPDSDLPAYEDVPRVTTTTEPQQQEPRSYLIHPELPNSQLSRDETTTSTHWPLYSQDARFLQEMLQDQAQYPPTFAVRFTGTHTETRRTKEKTEKVTVTDFDIRLDMTHLLVPNSSTHPSLIGPTLLAEFPSDKAYRGHRTKVTTASDPEIGHYTESYIRSYVDSPHTVRSFTLRRRITYHDNAALETLIKSLISSTNYRGHINVTFPITHNRITVYSPCWQNRSRDKTWLRWLFYLTFLWIFAWPYLWFVTRRWECVNALFPYSCSPECGNRKFVTKSEKEFFNEWRASMRRAVLARRQGWVDEEYKIATEEAAREGAVGARTGDTGAGGAMGFLRAAVDVARDVSMVGGWGADS